MNTTRDFVRSAAAGISVGRVSRAMPRSALPALTRAGLPVVSNRAFISSWMSRRGKFTPSALTARAI